MNKTQVIYKADTSTIEANSQLDKVVQRSDTYIYKVQSVFP